MEQEAAQNAWDLYDGSIAGATSDIYITTQVLVNPEMNKLHLLFLCLHSVDGVPISFKHHVHQTLVGKVHQWWM